MLRKVGRYAGYAVLWIALIAVWRWSSAGKEEHSREQQVTTVDITIEGGGSRKLVDAELMHRWFEEQGVLPVGHALAEVDLAELERVALQHSAVASANAYLTHDGRVDVRVSQREPVARLRVDGYDMYITSDGYIFPASDGYAVLVPVITGSYKPLFAADYSGFVSERVSDSIAELQRVVERLEKDKEPYYKQQQRYRKELRSTLNSRVGRELFMSDYEYAKHKEELTERKAEAQREYDERVARVEASLTELAEQQGVVCEQQRYVEQTGRDFERLLAFVSEVVRDRFWSAEVVQIVVSGGGTVPMQVAVVPRSGRYEVDMGYAENLEGRLASLRRVYDKVLVNVGWDRYTTISLRYDGQVVCR